MGRVISYKEKTGISDGDYLLLDNGEGGTKRIRADRVGIQLDPTLLDPNKAAPANAVKPVDPTLSQSGQAADAKATGDAVRGQVSQLSESIAEIEDDVNNVIHAFPNRFKELIPVETDISSTIGNCSGTGVIDTTNGARQHTDYLLISDYEKFGLAEDFKTSRLYWVRCFSDIGVFVGSANASAPVNTDTKSETILNAFPTAKYVVLAIKKSNDGSMVDADGGVVAYKYVKKMSGNVSLDDVYESKFKRDYYSEDISLQYNIDADGHYTKGWLKLPPNYKSSGRPVPLIVFVHGSSDFGNIDAPITNLYQDYYNFLKNCGYAVFDCYAWGNKYNASTGGFTQTWGTPINRKCYVSGINYIIENFNVSKDNIFVASKSLGGVQSLSMLYDETINIRAVGMLAPLLNPFEVYLGYDKTTRQTVTREFGFSADTGNVLDFDSVPSDAYWEYITENMDKWVGNVTYFNGLPIKNADKPNYYNNKAGFLDLIRSGLNRPLKIWIAKDDSALITSAKAMVQSLNNGGRRAEIHELPENTGAHHAVDNSPLALQKTNVTTRCGVHYDSVPLAYYELAEWFDKWCTE